MPIQALPSVEVSRGIVLFIALTRCVLDLAALIRPVFAHPSDQGPGLDWPATSRLFKEYEVDRA